MATNASLPANSLLSFSSRFVARIRKLNDWLDPARLHDPVLIARSPSPALSPLPGPWGFLTSGYIVGLIIMAVLIHRIQNIVVPPRHRVLRFPRPPSRHRSFFHVAYRAIFPLDFSSSLVRFSLRLPSIYFLSKSLLLWSTTLAQTTHKFPSCDSPWFRPLASWVAKQDTAALCWFTFCSVCGALCVEALTRGLEGTNSNASPFNLFGYAFLLHIYSSPMTHGTKLQGLPSRPDKHVVFTIILPLLQLTLLHCLGIKQTWSNHRLVPSAFVSITALVHFHWVLWFSDSTYPLLNYMPCLFESLLLSVTFLAVFLNGLTQILAEGSVSRPLFGHHAALLPRLDEDFSIALLRMGTASLETSSVAGLGNEVGGVALMPPPLDQTEAGTVALTRFGVSSVSHTHEGCGKNRRTKKGFANEIKNVKAASNDGDLWLDLAWYREFVRFAVGVARFLKRLYMLSRYFLRNPRMRLPSSPDTEDATPPDDYLQGERMDGQDVYGRFIRGEQLSDDEYDEYEPTSRSRSNSVESISSISDNAENTVYDNQVETVGLYADLSSAVATSTSASHLLAHLADHSSSPLTRRRFSRLVSGSSSGPLGRDTKDGWADVMHARRPSVVTSRPEDALDEARRNCVICTAEPRQIICWPYVLHFATTVEKTWRLVHLSQSTRAPVVEQKGYSKIYIP
ncbi:hypothetical protein J3R83DRAFT_4804 [Lanmaoa asiatica]|nr:hypothetical protein J3R83DRAFT_4804 [Lanmaoa asiatica]